MLYWNYNLASFYEVQDKINSYNQQGIIYAGN